MYRAHLYLHNLTLLLSSAALQVAPAELESVLLQHESVLAAAVVPVPDERAGELPRAYAVLKEAHVGRVSEEEIKEHVARQVAVYKQLAGGVVFVKSIPVSPSGKILRRELRAVAKQEQEQEQEKVLAKAT